jgi:hypothetical protein
MSIPRKACGVFEVPMIQRGSLSEPVALDATAIVILVLSFFWPGRPLEAHMRPKPLVVWRFRGQRVAATRIQLHFCRRWHPACTEREPEDEMLLELWLLPSSGRLSSIGHSEVKHHLRNSRMVPTREFPTCSHHKVF